MVKPADATFRSPALSAIPDATTSSGSRVRLVRYAPHERQPRHAHSRTTLTLVLRGSVEERVGVCLHRATVLSLVVKPAGTPHEDCFGPEGARTLQVTLSESDEAAASAFGAGMGSWRWIPAGDAARGMLSMLRLLDREHGSGLSGDPRRLQSDARRNARIQQFLHEVLGALEPAPPPRRAAPRWLPAVREALEEEARPIRSLASIVGVHPVHLAHAFRHHYGTTPSEYRRRARLHRAAALLSDTRLPLTEVAFASGFADQAHMTRWLRRATGATPGAFRRLAGGG